MRTQYDNRTVKDIESRLDKIQHLEIKLSGPALKQNQFQELMKEYINLTGRKYVNTK